MRRIVFGFNCRAPIGPQEARRNLLLYYILAIRSNLAYTFSNLNDYGIPGKTSNRSNCRCRCWLVGLCGTSAKLLSEALDTESPCRAINLEHLSC